MDDINPQFKPRKVDENAVKEFVSRGIHPVMARVYSGRGTQISENLGYNTKNLLKFNDLKNAKQMADIIANKIMSGKKFTLVADYDSDGATACAIGMRAMRGFGADIEFVVPDRFKHGYGLTPTIIEEILESGRKPDSIITVDNGIASFAGIDEANKHGISVLVTDHHLPGVNNGVLSLPNAECIVNPAQPGCEFGSKNLAGCGVIFYVMAATQKALQAKGWFEKHPEYNYPVKDLLDFVALGTVADVVKLDSNNRLLVHLGLEQIRSGRAHAGINAILDVAGRKIEDVQSSDMGFLVGPRLNAAGRMDKMNGGIQCLLTDDPEEAKEYATKLNMLNAVRKETEKDMQDQALSDVDQHKIWANVKPDSYSNVLFHPTWHEGVIGIVASRIKEKNNKPTIIFTRTSDGNIKGSCRSIPPLHMRDALDIVYKQDPTLLPKFGGHAMAAGLTIPEARFPEFAVAFEEACRQLITPEDLKLVIDTDGALEVKDMDFDLLEEINKEIWGQGFPAPTFQGEFKVISQRQVGQKQNHTQMTLGTGPEHKVRFDAILFKNETTLPDTINAVYTLSSNNFMNTTKMQLQIQKIMLENTPVHVNKTEFQDGPDGLSM